MFSSIANWVSFALCFVRSSPSNMNVRVPFDVDFDLAIKNSFSFTFPRIVALAVYEEGLKRSVKSTCDTIKARAVDWNDLQYVPLSCHGQRRLPLRLEQAEDLSNQSGPIMLPWPKYSFHFHCFIQEKNDEKQLLVKQLNTRIPMQNPLHYTYLSEPPSLFEPRNKTSPLSRRGYVTESLKGPKPSTVISFKER